MKTPLDLDIAEIARRAEMYRNTLEAARRRAAPEGFDWYPYDSLANFQHFDRLLTGRNRRLLELAGVRPVLDIGCADGACAFFLESLGCRVQAVDNPSTNRNSMEGLRLLKAALNSDVGIVAADLDSRRALPTGQYGLAMFCGILYHLKNPFFALEWLARSAEYCLLSTRVTRYGADRATRIEHVPVAYLVDPDETNGDATNYWVFSDTGLRRLVKRAGWDVLHWVNLGNTTSSDPASEPGNERVFCLLRSTAASVRAGVEYLHGWHPLEHDTWRWTERTFALRVPRPESPVSRMEFHFSLPEVLIAQLGGITLRASVNGSALPPATYSTAGDHIYAQITPVPAVAGDGPIEIAFELDRALRGAPGDTRELGVQVMVSAEFIRLG